MTSYRWHAQGITSGGIWFCPFGTTTTDKDPHTAAEHVHELLQSRYPGTVWHDWAGRPEGPGDVFMPILRTIEPTTTS